MNAVSVVCYGIAAIAFLLLAILMSVSWQGRRPGAYLIVASTLSAGWAGLLMAQAARGSSAMLPIYIAETLRNGAWLFALSSIAASSAPRGLLLAARATPFIALSLLFVLPIFSRLGFEPFDPELLLSRAGLAAALIALVLLEQIYRNASDTARDGLKFLVCGVGGMFAFDLFLYSQAELLRGITADGWTARGALNAFAVPLIAIAVRRNYPQWSLDVFVSRQVVLYTTTLMGVGGYLLLMAAGGYYVRQFGGSWGRLGQIMFFSGALLVLGLLLGSNALRRHTSVFISKHFYRNKYDYRVEWLRFIRTLSSSDEDDVRRTAIHAVAQILGSPGGVLFLLDDSGKRFVVSAAWPLRIDAIPRTSELAAPAALPRFLARTHWIIDLRELRRTPDVYDNIDLPDWLRDSTGLRIVSPLLQLDRLVGFFVLYDPPSPFDLTYEDRDLLKTVGRHVATHIAQHDADRKLAESRQFEAYNRLTAFTMHDLKNSVAQLRLVVDNAERHRRNPEFIDDAVGTIANTLERMTRLIEQLRGNAASTRTVVVDLVDLARRALGRCENRTPVPTLEAGTMPAMVEADPERLVSVLEHVIRNAQDATPEQGTVSVKIGQTPNAVVVLTVSDSGSGMDPDFVRDRLFRPFDSTKGSKGMGIGAYQAREYVRMLGGEVEVQSSPGSGTQFSISLPVCVSRRPSPAASAVATVEQEKGAAASVQSWTEEGTTP